MVTEAASGSAQPQLGRALAAASAFAVLQRLVMRGLGLISTILLVRLLTAEDFGIVAVAASVHTILEMLSQTGFGLALVRMREPSREHYDTVFTLGLARNALLAVALVAFAPVQASLMGDARVADVMRVVAASVMLQGFESLRMIDLQRELRFDTLMRYNVAIKIVQLGISLPLAFWLRNYWALVLAAPISTIVTIPLTYRIAPYRPRLSLRAWREVIGFSKWLMLGNLFAVMDTQGINLVVGRIEGMIAVGLFQVAYQVAALPISEIAAPLRGPAYAGFARVRHDPAQLRRQFMTGLAFQLLLIVPLCVGIGLTADEITRLFLGERWLSLGPLIPLIALYALFDGIAQYSCIVFIVLNRQRAYILGLAVLTVLRVTCLAIGAYHAGLLGAVWVMAVSAVLICLVWLVHSTRMLGVPVSDVVAALWRPFVAAAIMSAAVLVVPADLAASIGLAAWPMVVLLLAKSCVGALVYPAVVVALYRISGAPADCAEAQIMRLAGTSLSGIRSRLGV